MDYATKFSTGLNYQAFVNKYGDEEQRKRWQKFHTRIALTSQQRELLGSFKRQMQVICLAGTWCGDCVNQCPIFDHFAAACDRIDLRFFDRDANPDLGEVLKICGGARVPVVLFLSEDGQQLGWHGDRTLSKYRQVMAEQKLGGQSGLLDEEHLLAAVVQDWLNEFERAQWILRTSARLRKLHSD